MLLCDSIFASTLLSHHRIYGHCGINFVLVGSRNVGRSRIYKVAAHKMRITYYQLHALTSSPDDLPARWLMGLFKCRRMHRRGHNSFPNLATVYDDIAISRDCARIPVDFVVYSSGDIHRAE